MFLCHQNIPVTYSSKFVTVGDSVGGSVASYSVDGISWTSTNIPISASSVAYGGSGNVFVAVPSSTSSTTAAYSSDGIIWTPTTITASGGYGWKLAAGDGYYSVVNQTFDGGGSNRAAYSANGKTWISVDMPGTQWWYAVARGADKFVAISAGGGSSGIDNTRAVAYSNNDGGIWTQVVNALPTAYSYTGIAYGNGRFIAIATNTYTAYSTDGITWTPGGNLPGGINSYWVTIAYGNGRFVTLSDGINNTGAVYSTDNGATWTASTTTGAFGTSVAYAAGKFVTNTGYSSTDGSTWTYNPDVITAAASIAYGNFN